MVTDSSGIILPLPIERELATSYMDYAMSVIVSRALPDVRDGLKPVHRRILYAMDDLGLASGGAHKKSARIVGEVLGKYHPHSDAPVYEAMVRMAQTFSLRYPLVNGQGNFGSIDADPPAAMRYTEARLSRLAEEMLADIDKQTVDFASNFDDSLNEPTVLPARLPNLLINGSSGIAVGMATNIPPHHLGEIAEAIKYIIDYPDAGVDDLLKLVTGPDFPTGGIAFSGEDGLGIREVYATGRGRIPLRAVHHIEEAARGDRSQIVFTELPFQVNKAALIEQIANLVRDKRIDGVADLRDESDRHGLRVVVELKRDGNVSNLLAQLFKLTTLQTSFAVNMVALVNGLPRRIPLKVALESFINHRREIIRRRTKFDLEKAVDRHHIISGLLKAIDKIDAIIAAIRSADSADDAKRSLQGRPFKLTERQAQAVLDMQLRRLAALERSKLEEEFRDLTETIEYLEGLLESEDKIDELIKNDVDELTELYSGDRETAIVPQDVGNFSEEDLVAHQATVVSYSRAGYIKRMPLSTYRSQHRGGKGIKAMQTREEDAVRHLLVTDTHDNLLLFTDKGRIFNLKVHEIEERTREWRGLPIRNLIQIDSEENVTAIISVVAFDKDFLLLGTRNGNIKKTALSEFSKVRRAGLIAFNLRSGDELVLATTAHAGDDIVVACGNGLAVRFAVDTLREASRSSGGVRAIQVPGDTEMVGMLAVRKGNEFLTITGNGFGKRTPEREYPRKGRGGKGMIAHKVTNRTGPLVALSGVDGEEDLVLISAEGKFIRTSVSSIAQVGRSTQGVMVMRTDEGIDVAAIAIVDLSREYGETIDGQETLVADESTPIEKISGNPPHTNNRHRSVSSKKNDNPSLTRKSRTSKRLNSSLGKAVKKAKPAARKAVKKAKPAARKAVKKAKPAARKVVKKAKPAARKVVKKAKPAARKVVKKTKSQRARKPRR